MNKIERIVAAMILIAAAASMFGCASGRGAAFGRGFAQGAISTPMLPPTDQQQKDAHFRAYWDMKCDEIRKNAKAEGISEETLKQRMPLFRGDGLCVVK